MKKNNILKDLNIKDHKKDEVFRNWHDDKSRLKNKEIKKEQAEHNYILLGPPNVGKSTLFNKLTTSVAAVSNIDRLTVNDAKGKLKANKKLQLTDLPGIYNLSHPIAEELVVAHEMAHEYFSKGINIIACQSIERDLYLSIEAIETGMISTIALNMVDEINIDALNINRLSRLLNNVKIIPTQASAKRGIKEVQKSIIEDQAVEAKVFKYPKEIEDLVVELSTILPKRKIDNRFYALNFIAGNTYIIDFYKKRYPEIATKALKLIEKAKLVNPEETIYKARKDYIEYIIKESIPNKKAFFNKNKTKQRKFDQIFLNKWIGIPLFALILVAVYYIAFGPYMGKTLQDLWDESFLQEIVADQWIAWLFSNQHWQSDPFLQGFFIDGLIKGAFAVLSFIPPIAILFIQINILQQVGILSRISVLLDATFEKFGLSGRSIVNLLSGFGCAVPAVMMSRSTNSKKEKFIAMIITPFISCSARIVVYVAVCEWMFSKETAWLGALGFMFASGGVALLIGLLFSKTMFRKIKSFFIVEMVDWRKPDLFVVLKITWVQVKEFLVRATTIIVIASIIIWLLSHLGPNGGIIEDEDIGESFLAYIGKAFTYLFIPMGFVGESGWKLTSALFASFPAKEIALSNFEILFANNESDFFSSNIPAGIAFLTVFMSYVPCLATIAVMKKESSWKGVGLHLSVSLSFAYVTGIIMFWFTFLCMGPSYWDNFNWDFNFF